MGKNKRRDYSYHMTVSNLTEEEADNLSSACKRAKREYANEGRGISFTDKTCNIGNHLKDANRYIGSNNED